MLLGSMIAVLMCAEIETDIYEPESLAGACATQQRQFDAVKWKTPENATAERILQDCREQYLADGEAIRQRVYGNRHSWRATLSAHLCVAEKALATAQKTRRALPAMESSNPDPDYDHEYDVDLKTREAAMDLSIARHQLSCARSRLASKRLLPMACQNATIRKLVACYLDSGPPEYCARPDVKELVLAFPLPPE